MAPSLTIVQEAQQAWDEPATRARILEMHARGDSLVAMTDELGLGDALDDDLRAVVDGLSPEEVAVIRDAFVSAATVPAGAAASFPVDCAVTDVTGGVHVVAAGTPDAPIAQVLPGS
jgi:hypothetical protein